MKKHIFSLRYMDGEVNRPVYPVRCSLITVALCGVSQTIVKQNTMEHMLTLSHKLLGQ